MSISLNKDYCLHRDNWSTSIVLAKNLLDKQTDCTETSGKNGLQLPWDATVEKIKAGECLQNYVYKVER